MATKTVHLLSPEEFRACMLVNATQREAHTMRMRAKLEVVGVDKYRADGLANDNLTFSAVGKSGNYPDDGTDEDNTYSRFTPAAHLQMTVANPALLDQFHVGDKFYVDFTSVEG